MVTWSLHQGDSLPWMAAMADKSVDVCLCDPPYSEHVHGKTRRGGASAPPVDGAGRNPRSSYHRVQDLGFASLSAETMTAAAAHLARLTRRWALVFCDVESSGSWQAALTAAGLDHVRIGAWVKLGSTPQFTGDRPAHGFETIVMAHPKGKKRWNGGGHAAVYTHPIVLERGGQSAGRDGYRVHTTQKPLSLMIELVSLFSDPGETILDPFAGSGTTGCAALRLGRHFVGAEMDPQYHAVAVERLTAEAAGTTLQAMLGGQLTLGGAR